MRTVAGCLDHARLKETMHGAVGRKESLELTPALSSTPTSPLALQQALEAAQGWRGWERTPCKAERPGADPFPLCSSACLSTGQENIKLNFI